jgi:hypothetical protein
MSTSRGRTCTRAVLATDGDGDGLDTRRKEVPKSLQVGAATAASTCKALPFRQDHARQGGSEGRRECPGCRRETDAKDALLMPGERRVPPPVGERRSEDHEGPRRLTRLTIVVTELTRAAAHRSRATPTC